MSSQHSAEKHNAIAEWAHRLWEERGRPHGSPEEDWHRAEADLERAQASERGNTETPKTAPKPNRQKAETAD